MKKTTHSIISLLVIGVIVFSPLLPVKQAEAGTSIADGLKGCATNWLAGFLEKKVMSSIGGMLGGALGGMGGGMGGQQVPVFDEKVLNKNDDILNTGKEGNAQYRIKEYVEDCIAWWLSARLQSQMSSQMVSFVNQGNTNVAGGGSPAKFVVNYQDYFMKGLSQRTASFVDQLKNSGLSDDTKLSIRSFLFKQAFTNPVSSLNYSFPDEYKGFNDDFSKGGLDANQQISNPENNPFGQALIAANVLKTKQDQEMENTKTDLTSSGFPSVQTCVSKSESGVCQKYQNTTPGNIIEDQLKKVLGSQVDQLNVSDELNEIVAQFFSSMVSRVFNSGGGLLNTDLQDITPDDSGGVPTPEDITKDWKGLNEKGAGTKASEFTRARQALIKYINDTIGLGGYTPGQNLHLQNFKKKAANATSQSKLDQVQENFEVYVASIGGGSVGDEDTTPPPESPGSPGSP